MTELRERLAAYIARSLESWPSGDAGIFAYTFAASWTTARSSIPRKPARRWPTPPTGRRATENRGCHARRFTQFREELSGSGYTDRPCSEGNPN
jgi:hypothetical protein